MKQLLSNLIKKGALKTKNIVEAFFRVDRKDFVVPEHKSESYGDYPLPIGYGQTISQPTTVALMLEMLQPERDENILDVGSGSGWTTALLADIVGPRGKVFGIELIPELVSFGQKNLAKYAYPQAKILLAEKNLGLPKEVPFNKILVSASNTSNEIPKELVEQLKIGGTMVVPIGYSVYKVCKKSKEKLDIQEFPGFSFVPLIRK